MPFLYADQNSEDLMIFQILQSNHWTTLINIDLHTKKSWHRSRKPEIDLVISRRRRTWSSWFSSWATAWSLCRCRRRRQRPRLCFWARCRTARGSRRSGSKSRGTQFEISEINTGWPFRLCQTSCWHQNKSSVLIWGSSTKTQHFLWFYPTWMVTLYNMRKSCIQVWGIPLFHTNFISKPLNMESKNRPFLTEPPFS